MTTHVTGLELKSYYNSATHASPTWVEVPRIADENVDFPKETAQIRNRESAFSRVRGTFKGVEVSFTYHEKKNQADTIFDKIHSSWLNGDIDEWAFMDGSIATTGNKGFRAGIEITKITKKRELENITEWEVEGMLAEFVESSALVEPDRYEVPV